MKARTLLTLATCMASAMPTILYAGNADSSKSQSGVDFYVASDNDGFVTRRATVDYLLPIDESEYSWGGGVRRHEFRQGAWSRKANQIFVRGEKNDDQAWSFKGEVGVLEQNALPLITMDATLRLPISESTAVEAFASREYVETADSLDRGIHATFAGVRLEQALNPHLTAIGTAGYQEFSDGNHRVHGRARLIYQPFLGYGLTLQARYSHYESGDAEVRRPYFNPDKYEEGMLFVGWRKHGPRTSVAALAGLGRQYVNDEPGTPTHLFELNAKHHFTKTSTLSVRAGVSQGAAAGGPDQRSQYLNLGWNKRF